jgi:hypothetical protein
MRIVCFVVCCVIASAVPARSTVLVSADLGELTREARAIARGRVVALESRWAADRRSIETVVSLEVEEYLKGGLGAVLQFRVPGGRVGRYRNIIAGAPEFAVDQRIVVFLGARGPTVPFVLGFNQGVFRVVPSDEGVGWTVTPSPVMPSATPGQVRPDERDRRPVPLADFQARVRDLLARTR